MINSEFPKFSMSEEQKERIWKNVKSGEGTKKRAPRHLLPRLLSAAVFLVFFGLLGTIFFEKYGPGADPLEQVVLDLPADTVMEKQKDGSYRFIRNGAYIGGLAVTTAEELEASDDRKKYMAWEVDPEVPGMLYPTERRMFHVKTMDAIQEDHFYIKPEEDSDFLYDLYFNRPAIELEEAIEITRTFQLK